LGKSIHLISPPLNEIVLAQVISSIEVKRLSKEYAAIGAGFEQGRPCEPLNDLVGRGSRCIELPSQVANADWPTMAVKKVEELQNSIDSSPA
jgi:hypothetical protein